MYIDIISRCVAKAMYLEKPERLTIWNDWSRILAGARGWKNLHKS